MSADSVTAPMAVCEICWLSEHSRWEPESMDETGNLIMRLTGVDVPHKINNGEVDICCTCGGLTVSGIYEFKEQSEVFFYDDNKNEYELEMNDYDGDD
jgi:hypothetical protein